MAKSFFKTFRRRRKMEFNFYISPRYDSTISTGLSCCNKHNEWVERTLEILNLFNARNITTYRIKGIQGGEVQVKPHRMDDKKISFAITERISGDIIGLAVAEMETSSTISLNTKIDPVDFDDLLLFYFKPEMERHVAKNSIVLGEPLLTYDKVMGLEDISGTGLIKNPFSILSEGREVLALHYQLLEGFMLNYSIDTIFFDIKSITKKYFINPMDKVLCRMYISKVTDKAFNLVAILTNEKGDVMYYRLSQTLLFKKDDKPALIKDCSQPFYKFLKDL